MLTELTELNSARIFISSVFCVNVAASTSGQTEATAWSPSERQRSAGRAEIWQHWQNIIIQHRCHHCCYRAGNTAFFRLLFWWNVQLSCNFQKHKIQRKIYLFVCGHSKHILFLWSYVISHCRTCVHHQRKWHIKKGIHKTTCEKIMKKH